MRTDPSDSVDMLEKLVLNEALRKVQASLSPIHSAERRGILYLHMAPIGQMTDVGELNRLLGLMVGALARLGKPDVLSFRNVDGTLWLGRLTWYTTVITVYPAAWLARQMGESNPCPEQPVRIGQADLAA